MDLKRILALALCSTTLALVIWGLLFAKPPLKLAFFKVGVITESSENP